MFEFSSFLFENGEVLEEEQFIPERFTDVIVEDIYVRGAALRVIFMDTEIKESLSLIFSEFEKTRRYVCDAPGCGKTFAKNNFLEFHIRTHTDEVGISIECCH